MRYNISMVENLGQQANSDIAQALKDFEKDAKDYVPEENKAQTFDTGRSKIVNFIINNSGGIIKEPEQANYVIFGVTLILFLGSMFIFSRGGSKVEQDLIDIRTVDQSQFAR